MENLEKKYSSLSKNELTNQFELFCYNGNFKMIKFLLTFEHSNKINDINKLNNLGFKNACAKGHLKIINYLRFSKEISKNLNITNENLFYIACKYGKINIIKNIFKISNIKNENIILNQGFLYSCEKNQTKTINFLLGINKVDIHIKKDKAFISACENNNYETIKYMIFNLGIKKTNDIKKYLESSDKSKINQLFIKRDLNENLTKILDNNKAIIKNVKKI